MGRDESSEKAPWRFSTRLGLLVCILLVLVWGYSVVAGPLSLGGSPPVRQFQIKDGVFGFAMIDVPAGASAPASN